MSNWVCIGKIPNGSCYVNTNSEGNYDMYVFADMDAEKDDNFSNFKDFHVCINREKDFSARPESLYSLPSFKLGYINIFSEYKDTYYGWLFLGRPKTSEDEMRHKELMSKLWIEGDNVIFQHDSSEEITNGRVEAGYAPRLYSNNTDYGAYFWASKEKGKDPSNENIYTYYCSAPIEDVYDYEFNPKHYPSLRMAYIKEKVVVLPWGKNKNVIVAIAGSLPIIGKKKNN